MARDSLGLRAKKITQITREKRIQSLVKNVIEPAVLGAASASLSFCTLTLNSEEYMWLVDPSGESPLFEKIVLNLGLTLNSFEKRSLSSSINLCESASSVFTSVVSWGDDDTEECHRADQSEFIVTDPVYFEKEKEEEEEEEFQEHQHHQQQPNGMEEGETQTPVPPPRPQVSPDQLERPFVGKYVQYPANLHTCCKRGDYEVLKQVLELNGPLEINGPDSFGYAPLHHAVSCGYIDIVRLLLHHGANQEQQGMKSLTPLHCAAYGGKQEIVALLAPNVFVDSPDSSQRTPLHWATERGFTGVVEELLRNGADPLKEDRYGMSAIKYASFWGYGDIIRIFESSKIK
eukprot:CAMPEP_0201483172 /NCGR_PEP_ID=MMETSP0151_2-20130828/7389_1 /ASSEMBLY_ACC=CAM_ASM_000257 /TAXON_ID=200890 /ORGANISM="Paramoeba atlantica, Strain 621/1 / CCAP 1560/9" /LENGTH=345 /DNA_ID=CAMNT_0047866183 /DNA_START=107 /DNA_END=1144 /DNA_ORIENTATION=+